METDWSVAAGGEDPVIEAGWADAATGLAWADLRVDAETQRARIAALPEASSFPALADALALLNAPLGLLMTTKCDHWVLSEEERAELGEALDARVAQHGCGSYIDVLLVHALPMADFLLHEEWARITARRCSALEPDDVRLDLIIRPARLRSGNDDVWGYGLTVYHYAAADDAVHASAACAEAMRQTIPVLIAAVDTLFVPANEAAAL